MRIIVKIHEICKSPIFSIASLVIGLIGIALAIYFGTQYPYLTYHFHPYEYKVVSSKHKNPSLKIMYEGQEVKDDVCIIRYYFKNTGRKPVRKDDILGDKLVKIQFPEDIKLLEVKIVDESRSEIGLAINESQLSKGIVLFDWDILEKGDGFILQFMYEGSIDNSASIETHGAAVSQRKLNKYNVNDLNEKNTFLINLFIIMVILMGIYAIRRILIAHRQARILPDDLHKESDVERLKEVIQTEVLGMR